MAVRNFTDTQRLIEMMRLVECESAESDVNSINKAAFEWEHSRRLELGKWLLASGAAAIIASLTLLAKSEPVPRIVLISLGVTAGILIVGGLGALRRAKVVHTRFVVASILCARLREIRPFLSKLRREGEL